MKNVIKLTALAVATLGLSGTAFAQQAGADFTVSANVLPSCQISSPNIVFPVVSVLKAGQSVSSASSFQLNCTGSIPYSVKASVHGQPGYQDVTMKKNGVNESRFEAMLYKDSSFTQRFGVNTANNIVGTSVGGVETINFYARATNNKMGGELVPEGDYVGQFDLTVTF